MWLYKFQSAEDFLKFGCDLKSGGKGKKTLWTQRHLSVVKRAFSSNLKC